MKEYILCAAIHYPDIENTKSHGLPKNMQSGIVVCGRRHHNCIFTLYKLANLRTQLIKHTQGFITSGDRFVDRREAGQIALRAGQIKEATDCLYSEDLY